MGVLRTVGWAAAVVYASIPLFWFMVHPRADYWRERKRIGRPAYKLLVPLWAGIWVALGGVTWPGRRLLMYQTAWAWLPAGMFFGMGLFLYASAKRGFTGEHLSGQLEIESHRRQQLIISGIRRRIRHPIYLGHFCELLGWSFGTGMVVIYVLTAFAAITGAIMVRLEDNELEQRFGEEYRRYRQSVPAVLPRWKRRHRLYLIV